MKVKHLAGLITGAAIAFAPAHSVASYPPQFGAVGPAFHERGKPMWVVGGNVPTGARLKMSVDGHDACGRNIWVRESINYYDGVEHDLGPISSGETKRYFETWRGTVSGVCSGTIAVSLWVDGYRDTTLVRFTRNARPRLQARQHVRKQDFGVVIVANGAP